MYFAFHKKLNSIKKFSIEVKNYTNDLIRRRQVELWQLRLAHV
jgi:hypothetical protein